MAMRVIVVGGGIGGLAAAVGLRRAGHGVIVLERHAAWHDLGMNPRDVVDRWVELFNAGDAEGLAALYLDDGSGQVTS